MLFLRNPGGRIVIFDTQEHYDQYVNVGGFTVPTQDEINVYLATRTQMIEDIRLAKEMNATPHERVHFATVTPGGTDGYGIASTILIRHLKKLGLDVRTYYNGQRLSVLFHNPYSLMSMETPYRMIYTMFESDRIPDDWIDYLNVADAVLVPSTWCKDTFERSGIPAIVVPLGYDENTFVYKERTNKRDSHGTYTFLHYNAYNARKGFLEVFKAFTKEFGPDEPVKMIFKTTLTNPYARFPINADIYKNIEVIAGQVSPYEILQLVNRSDCFVFPSRGEGFGVPPLECMATGMPAIVPNAHGISEYFDPQYMYEVKVAGPSPALYTRYKGQDVGQMVTCDVDDLRKQMRWVYEHEDEAAKKGKAASEYVKRWTLSNTAAILKKAIEQTLARPPKLETISNFLELERVR